MSQAQTHEFTVTGSELLVDAPIIALRRDQVVMPGGEPAAREIVEHFGATAVVASDGENIALVRQYRHSVRDRLWELPAGILDVKDEPALVGAKRELVEEAGLEAERWDLLLDLVTSPGFCEEAVRVFLARELRQVPQPEAAEEEADMVLEWVPLERARHMVLTGQVVNSIAAAGILSAWAVLREGAAPRSTDEPFTYRPRSLAARRSGPDMKRP